MSETLKRRLKLISFFLLAENDNKVLNESYCLHRYFFRSITFGLVSCHSTDSWSTVHSIILLHACCSLKS